MIDHEVVISGGGPTGLTLAAELALAGIDVAIIERRSTQDLVGARAGGLHVRTIEVFDQRGIADRFLTVGQKHPMAITFCKTRLDLTSLPSRHNYFLSLWQQQTERILAKWVEELGVPIYRGRELKSFEQNEATVEMTLVDGSLLRAKYLVGCDGGRSTVRKTAGIEFAGWDATKSWLIAELQFLDEPAWALTRPALTPSVSWKMARACGTCVKRPSSSSPTRYASSCVFSAFSVAAWAALRSACVNTPAFVCSNAPS